MRIILAIKCFFAVLFGSTLPVALLPAPEGPSPEDVSKDKAEREKLQKDLDELKKRVEALEPLEAQLAETKKAAEAAESAKTALQTECDTVKDEKKTLQEEFTAHKAESKEAVSEARSKLDSARNDGALALLSWLQREGRLIDFLREEIDAYEDEQIGAAVRAIHQGCRKVLDEALGLEPVLSGEEGDAVEVPVGFDPVAIQLSGNVKGDPPFKGTLVHHGWKSDTIKVPVPEAVDTTVLAPAEVEL